MRFIYLEVVSYDWRPEESDVLSLFPVIRVPSGCTVMLNLLRFGWRCIQKKIQLLYFRGNMRVLECFKQIRPRNMWGSVPVCRLSPWLCRHYEYIKLLQFDFLLFKGILMFSDKLLNTTWCIKGRKIDCKMRTWNHKGAIITQCFS